MILFIETPNNLFIYENEADEILRNNISIIINGLSDSLKVGEMGKNIPRFKEKTFEILKQNNNFNKTINEIEPKPEDRLFL